MLIGCRPPAPGPAPLDSLAHEYVRLTVQMGARDLDSLDFATGSDAGDASLREYPASFAAIHDSAVALRAAVAGVGAPVDAARQQMLVAQIDAMILRCEQLQGHNRSFDAESRLLFGVVALQDTDAAHRKRVREQIALLLGESLLGASLPGDPSQTAEAYARFGAQFVVPPERVPVVFEAALEQCRAITLQHMPLPANEHVDVKLVGLKPWSAYSTYLGNAHSLIQLNMDYPLTVDRLLELACHEGYPGHHVFNLTRDAAVVQQQHREEFRVQPTFSPQSYVSEAAASYAPDLALPMATRLHIDRDILAPLAGLKSLDFARYLGVQRLVDALDTAEPSIAREYLDGSLDFARADAALERETLMLHGEATLLYLNEFRTYMLAYTQGYDTMRGRIEDGSATDAERWLRYRRLMTEPVVSLPAIEGHNAPDAVLGRRD
jgi:hypothetical protein